MRYFICVLIAFALHVDLFPAPLWCFEGVIYRDLFMSQRSFSSCEPLRSIKVFLLFATPMGQVRISMRSVFYFPVKSALLTWDDTKRHNLCNSPDMFKAIGKAKLTKLSLCVGNILKNRKLWLGSYRIFCRFLMQKNLVETIIAH